MTRNRQSPLKGLAYAVLCGALASCAQQGGAGGSTGQTVRISPRVWSYYEEYAARYQPLYFAVSPDGEYAGYNYCDDRRCVADHAGGRDDAVALCEGISKQECLIFAYDGKIKVPYEIKP